MGEQKLYEFDKERNQYRKRYSKTSGVDTSAPESTSIYARSAEQVQTSYRKVPRGANPIETKKKLKRIFWVFFVIIVAIWGYFVVRYLPDRSTGGNDNPKEMPLLNLKR